MVKNHNFFRFLAFLAIFMAFPHKSRGQGLPVSIEDLKKIEEGVREAVAKVGPATVSIVSKSTGGSGSGVIISEDGLILTAAHVIANLETMQPLGALNIILPDGEEYEAKTLGMNFELDAGMVQITNLRGHKVPFAKYRSSKNIKTGDYVVAMGHAGGYDPLRPAPVRFGRVITQNTHHFFTSDCTIIGGDSGGPLVNMYGEVIGIHSSIGESSVINNHAGLSGFLRDWDRLRGGDVWGELIVAPELNPEIAFLGVESRDTGSGQVLIVGVTRGSPARKAGLRTGDFLLDIDGVKVRSGQNMLYTISSYKPGDTVDVRYRRRGEVREAKVTFAKRGDYMR